VTLIRRQLVTALGLTVVLTLLLGVGYPLVITGIAQLGFHHQANGSLVTRGGKVVGSSLIGQEFTSPKYFHPRPSAAGEGYDPTQSGASNLGPSNPDLLASVAKRVDAYRTDNGLPADATVPVDAVTASGSGLDPDISVANADLQAARVAKVRGLAPERVLALVRAHTDDRPWGFLGERTVNVLDLDLALDQLH